MSKGLQGALQRVYIGSGPLYPKVDTTYLDYVQDVGSAMRRELEGLPEGKMKRGIEHRSHAIQYCACSVEGYVCGNCGEPAEASGSFYDPETMHGHRRRPCHSRICPRCARRRSAELKARGRLLRAAIGEDLPLGWSWKFLTITARYDYTKEDDLTVAALRERLAGFRKAWRAVWAWYKAGCGTDEQRAKLGAMCAVELAGVGHVHLHCLFLGPFIEKDRMEDVARSAWPHIGFSNVEQVGPSAIQEVLKYPIESKGGAAEAWLGGRRALEPEFKWIVADGEPRKVWTGRLVPALVHPTLAARWEIALYGRRVFDSYGSFREIMQKQIDVREKPLVERLPARCACGSVHAWERIVEPVNAWIARFAGTGRSALFNPRAVARRKARGRYGGEESG